MPKLEITLKQHTPMIHFQHDQAGATLRATELKPKIDDFIVNKLIKICPDIYEEYKDIITSKNFPMSKNDKVPSPYKVRVNGVIDKILFCNSYIPKSKSEEFKKKNITPKSNMPYFGTAYAVEFKNKELNVEIFSFNHKIVELIKEVIPYVFLYNNFGQRQSKGFGSFTVKSIDGLDNISEVPKNFECMFGKNGVFFKKENTNEPLKELNTNEPLKELNNDYQLLKSGKNKPYAKSKLFEYMCKEGISWEKKEIKTALKKEHPEIFEKLKHDTNMNRIEDYNTSREPRYIRAMLGLAGNNQYIRDGQGLLSINIKHVPSNNEQDIERFKSPITFKIIDNITYAIPDEDILEKMYDKTFEFSFGPKKNKNVIIPEIETPSKTEFNLINFLSSKTHGLVSLGYKKIGGTND